MRWPKHIFLVRRIRTERLFWICYIKNTKNCSKRTFDYTDYKDTWVIKIIRQMKKHYCIIQDEN